MENDTIKQFRLGLVLVTGTVLLASAMYLIGRNQNLFGSTIRLVTYFNNVSGLQPGNTVRFAGSDAGTVESVEVENDTAVQVVIILDTKFALHIRQDAMAAIGTDGLMGNKLINIINKPGSTAENVKEGSTVFTRRPVETDEMLRTLNQTNEYAEGVALNLKNVTDKISDSRGTLWKLLTDTSVAADAEEIFDNMNRSSRNIAELTAQLNTALTKINQGNGLLGTLLTDTLLPAQLQRTAFHLQVAGRQSEDATSDLLNFIRDIDQGKGTIGLLLRDSTMSGDLRTSITSFRQSARSLQQTLEAIQNIPLLKKYLDEEKKRINK